MTDPDFDAAQYGLDVAEDVLVRLDELSDELRVLAEQLETLAVYNPAEGCDYFVEACSWAGLFSRPDGLAAAVRGLMVSLELGESPVLGHDNEDM